jgi:Lon-like ATP-dependent protease
MENLPVDQSVAMTGSMSVRGDVLPVGGVTNKVDAAIDAGFRAVIVPKSNAQDISISKERLKRIRILPVRSLADVIGYAFKPSAKRAGIIKRLRSRTGE